MYLPVIYQAYTLTHKSVLLSMVKLELINPSEDQWKKVWQRGRGKGEGEGGMYQLSFPQATIMTVCNLSPLWPSYTWPFISLFHILLIDNFPLLVKKWVSPPRNIRQLRNLHHNVDLLSFIALKASSLIGYWAHFCHPYHTKLKLTEADFSLNQFKIWRHLYLR